MDELNPDTQKMMGLRNTLIQFTEEINESLKDTTTMVKTTYFQEISNKVDTVMRKSFNENM